MKSNLSVLGIILCALEVFSEISCLCRGREVLLSFLSNNSMVSGLTLRPFIHLDLSFAQKER